MRAYARAETFRKPNFNRGVAVSQHLLCEIGSFHLTRNGLLRQTINRTANILFAMTMQGVDMSPALLSRSERRQKSFNNKNYLKRWLVRVPVGGLLEHVRAAEKAVFLEDRGLQLQADGQSGGGETAGDGNAGQAGQVRAHCVQIE
jgi:hypothetical protein